MCGVYVRSILMAVLEKEDIIFNQEQDNVHSQNIMLQSFEDYVCLLNDTDYANSLINREGTITSPDVRGVFIRKQNGKLNIIPGQEFNPIIYRGQCNNYPFIPTSQRYELFDGKERVRHSIDWIKSQEFKRLLSNTPYNTRANEIEVLDCRYELDLDIVSKQYNFVSDYLDVTRNLMVAFFFAYTYWDIGTSQLRPIENFENNVPMLYIGSLKDLYYQAPDSVKNICFQPVVHAKAQQTLSINVSKDRDFIKGLFKAVELPKNPVAARNVYDQFEGGDLLFPQDYVSKCALRIREYNMLQEDLIDEYCNLTATNEKWLKSEYKELGYDIVNQLWDIPEQTKNLINKEIDDYIMPYLHSNFIYRKVNVS